MRVLILDQYFPLIWVVGLLGLLMFAKGLLRAGCEVIVVAAFPHSPAGHLPERYGWKPLSVEYEDGLNVFRTFFLLSL